MQRKNLRNLGRTIFWPLFVGIVVFLVYEYRYTMTVPVAVQEDDIREAVLRQGLGEQLANCGPGKQMCCMSVAGIGDPSGAFISRFQAQFRKGSECTWQKPSAFPIYISSGKPASIINVGLIEWLGPTLVRLDAGVVCGMLCGTGGRFVVRREGNRWVVETLSRWIS